MRARPKIPGFDSSMALTNAAYDPRSRIKRLAQFVFKRRSMGKKGLQDQGGRWGTVNVRRGSA